MSAPGVDVEMVEEDDIAALLEMGDEEFAEAIQDTLAGEGAGEADWACFLEIRVVRRTIAALKTLILAGEVRRNELYESLNSEVDSAAPRARFVRETKREISRLLSRHREMGLRLGQANKVQRRANAARNIAQQEAKRERFGGVDQHERQLAHIKRCDEEIRQLRNNMRILAFAIQGHRLAAVAAGLDAEPGDRKLWAVLDEVEVRLGDGVATLTEMLGSGAWYEETPP